jgi:hypothetical protein
LTEPASLLATSVQEERKREKDIHIKRGDFFRLSHLNVDLIAQHISGGLNLIQLGCVTPSQTGDQLAPCAALNDGRVPST